MQEQHIEHRTLSSQVSGGSHSAKEWTGIGKYLHLSRPLWVHSSSSFPEEAGSVC